MSNSIEAERLFARLLAQRDQAVAHLAEIDETISSLRQLLPPDTAGSGDGQQPVL